MDYVADVYPEFYSQEMESALANVRKLALFHKESLVNSVCDTFASFNGREASVNDLAAIFSRIKSQFAEEARDELSELDSDDEEEDLDDSDYDPNDVRDRVQVQQDLDEDFLTDAESEYDDESDSDDSSYDENNFKDLNQQALDQEEDVYDSDEPLEKDNTFRVELDEEEVINAETFDAEYFGAIEVAKAVAKSDAIKIIESIQSEYGDEYSEDKLADVIAKTFEGIDLAQNEEVEESEDESKDSEVEKKEEVDVDEDDDAESEDPEVFREEMDLALANVRKLASYHQEEFIVKISDLYSLYNGSAPTVDELADIFTGIKQEFADEAADEIFEAESGDDEEESDKDSDYDPKDAADIKQVEEDEEEDYSEDESSDKIA